MTTQIQSARRGIVTYEAKQVSEEEDIPVEKLLKLVASGRVVITRNLKRESVKPLGIGEGLRTKINANVGSSADYYDADYELKKAKIAIEYGADTIMDLSTGGDIDNIRRKIIKNTNVPIGTVPIYQAGIEASKKKGAIIDMDEDDMFKAIVKHAEDGVDFITVHVGVTKKAVELLKKRKRIIPMVSRGGTFHAAWIIHNNQENPLYSNFDYLLEIAKEYDLTLSLGDGLRPGCIHDASDELQMQELLTISELVGRAREKEIQVIVEGPGHVPIHQIGANVRIQKALCKGAPFYVLGPLVTDLAPGYDHITGAIGGAIAAMEGADFLCYVTPAEHLGLPDEEDVKQGVIASKIAAHAADIAKLGDRALKLDEKMAQARIAIDWEKQYKLSFDPKTAKRLHERMEATEPKSCTMCGRFCAMKIISEALDTPELKKLKC
ncbi:MAG: phosphomethylpyrimidine synthase ThiC [Candidatus Jordarchaeaceae archaeon]